MCRTAIELAIWSTRFTKPRRKIVLVTIKRFEVTEKPGNNTVDYRVSGVHLSAFEQQDTTRENKVKHPIEKFDNHKHKTSFVQDLSQTQKITSSAENRKI